MYAISYPSGTVRLDGAVVPQDDRTPEHQAYVEWLAQGNTPAVQQDARDYRRIVVDAWQFIQALIEFGLLDRVDAAASNSSSALVRHGWARAPKFATDDPFVIAVCADLAIDDDTKQSVFERAESL